MSEGPSVVDTFVTTAPGQQSSRWPLALRTQALYCLLFLAPLRWQLGPTTVGLLDVFALGMGLWLFLGPVQTFSTLVKTPILIPLAAYSAVAFMSLTVAASTSDF